MCAVGLRVCSQPMGWSAGLDVLLPMLSTQTGIDVIALMTALSTVVFRTNLAGVVQAPWLDWPHLRRRTRTHPALHQRVNLHRGGFRLPVWKKWPRSKAPAASLYRPAALCPASAAGLGSNPAMRAAW